MHDVHFAIISISFTYTVMMLDNNLGFSTSDRHSIHYKSNLDNKDDITGK